MRSMLATLKMDSTVRAGLIVGVSLIVSAMIVTTSKAQQAQGRVFTGDAGIIYNVIKADQTAAFEAMIPKLKEALAKSTDPARKQQAASWKVFKMMEKAPDGNTLYLYVFDPAVKGADYTFTKILAEGLPAEAQQIYDSIKTAFVGQNLANLQLIADMK